MNQRYQQRCHSLLHFLLLVMFITFVTLLTTGCSRNSSSDRIIDPLKSDQKPWTEKMESIRWVAYSPSTGNPNISMEPEAKDIKADLTALRSAHFTGLVTYGCGGNLGKELPRLAEEVGFKGLIIGVWNPKNEEELLEAKNAASSPIVLGFCVGNEGFGERYNLSELTSAIEKLRNLTGKAVTTTEQIEDYYNEKKLVSISDWVFPNVHPYFHHIFEPKNAVQWTKEQSNRLKATTDKFILFKEVGLPTAGNKKANLSEKSQEQYYLALAKTDVPFVYFEAFDLTWKNHLPIEPHWGIFRSDRTPKSLASKLITADAK